MTIEDKIKYFQKYGIMFTDGEFEYKILSKKEMLIQLLKQL